MIFLGKKKKKELFFVRERNIAVNYSFYVKFWEIQSYFSNPNSLNDSENFRKFESVSFKKKILFLN